MYRIDFTNIESLTAAQIEKLIIKHNKNLARYNKLEGYYGTNHEGIEKIVEQRRQMDPTKPNHKILTNFPQYIVDVSVNYLLGTPPTYSSANKKALSQIQAIMDRNYEQDHNVQLGRTAGIYGVSYELVYLNKKGEICITRLDVKNTIIIESLDIDPEVKLAINYYIVKDEFTDELTYKAELYWEDRIEYWSGDSYSALQLTYVESHEFDGVPVIVVTNNEDLLADFENQLTLIDDLELRMSDCSNQGDFFNNSMLVAEMDSDRIIGPVNYGMLDDDGKPIDINAEKQRILNEKLIDMKRQKFLLIPPSESSKQSMYYLTPNINDEADRNQIAMLENNIHKFSGVPDISDENFSGVQSGEAMKYKLFSLEQVAKKKERKFKKALYQRLEMICSILRFKGISAYAEEFEITFSRSLPINLTENAEAIKKFAETGLFSTDTLLANSTIVTDVEKEKELIKSSQNATKQEENEQINAK